MKIVNYRVVGKVRWLYLIDVLHHKYKVKNIQDGRRIWSLSLETQHCNTSKCLGNIEFAVLIWLNSVLSFMRKFDCLEFIWWVSVSSCAFLQDFRRSTPAKKEEYENARKSLPKTRKKYSTSPFLVVLLKVTSQKPTYYESPVSRVFTCFIKVVYSPTGIEKVLPSG